MIKSMSVFSFLICTVLYTAGHSSEILTLDDCLNRAKGNSPVIRQAENAIQSSQLLRQELGATARPQAKLSAGASYAPFSSHFGYDPAVSNGGELGSQVIVEQPLYDGGRRGAKSAQLKIDFDRLKLEKQVAERDLEFEIKSTFFEALQAHAEADLGKQSVDQLSDYFELVKKLNASGAVGYSDLLKTEAQLNEASITSDQAQESESMAKTSLAELMGNPENTSFDLVGDLSTFLNTRVGSAESNVQFDSSHNLDLNIAELNYQRSLLDVRAIRRERLPSISLQADAGLLTSRQNLLLPSSERSSMLGYSAGIVLEIPLFDWGGRKFREQESRLTAKSFQFQAETLKRSVQAEYLRTRLQLDRAIPRLASIRSNIKIAEESFLLAKSRYASGSAPSADALNAQQILIDTKRVELQVLSEINQLSAKLEQITTQ